MIESPLNPVDTSYTRFLYEDEKARQRAIRRCRAYASGKQFVRLTDRLKQFLGDPLAGFDDADMLRLNVCHTVIRAVSERMIVQGFSSGNATFQKLANEWWKTNRMDARADDVHDAALRDAETFVLVSWRDGAPHFMPHPRYVEPENDALNLDGDGYGVKVFYQDDDDNGTMLYAVKRWFEVVYEDGKRKTRQRATLYYPDRVEKYVVGVANDLQPVRDDGDASWPIPWLDRRGMPLGIPVVHVKNPNLSSEIWEAIPTQNAINKTLVDLMSSSDADAFRILVALGWEPFDEDGNPLTIEPGTWIGTSNPEGKVQAIDPSELTNQLELLDSLIQKVAQVTDTPVARFITTKAIAGADTQKQQEAPLLAKIRKRQTLYGNAWEDVMSISRRLYNTFGDGGLDEAALISCEWVSADVRDEDAAVDRALKKQTLRIPDEQIWRELGYNEEQIAEFSAAREREQARIQQQATQSTTQAAP